MGSDSMKAALGRMRLLSVLTTMGVLFATAHAMPGNQDTSDRRALAGAAVERGLERATEMSSVTGFLENRGQWDSAVHYFGRAGAIEATLVSGGLVLRPAPDLERGEWAAPIVLRFPNAGAVPEGEEMQPTQFHFLKGTGSARDVRSFQRVVYREASPGIDVVLRITEEEGRACFAYDLLVAAWADLSEFVLEVEGVSKAERKGESALSMTTAAGVVEQRIGPSWQLDPETGTRQAVAANFARVVVDDRGPTGSATKLRFGFDAPERDSSREFVLDPSLVFATYIGGPGLETLKAIDVDAAGSTYLTCRTNSLTPTTPGAFQPNLTQVTDAWIGKLSADGKTLIWATYLGASDADDPYGIDIDADATIVVFGRTWSPDFPTTLGSLQPVFQGTVNDLFVTRLAPDGGSLVWSTYYGGPGSEVGQSSALALNGDVLVTAEAVTALPAPTPGAFDTVHNSGDQLLARISADGTTLLWQTYFKASRILDIAVDTQDYVYITGDILPADFPLPATPGAYKTAVGSPAESDAFAAKLSGDGEALVWATYFGGEEGAESAWSIDVDAGGAVYLCGQTDSDDLPTTPGAFDGTLGSANDGFVAKLLPSATQLAWSTYLGGSCCSGGGYVKDLAVDSAGNVYAAGSTNESNFPVTWDAFQSFFKGSFPSGDATLTKLDVFGETLVYSTYYGGTNSDYEVCVGLDGAQQPRLALLSYSSNAPSTAGSYDTTANGAGDINVAKFSFVVSPWTILGGAKKGEQETPNLIGSGLLFPGSFGRVSLRGGKPHANGWILVGLSQLSAPVFGGTVVPAPDLVLPWSLGANGGFDFNFIWPSVPAGAQIYTQVWLADRGASHGWSASNALRLSAQ